jgi:hypothetical protein
VGCERLSPGAGGSRSDSRAVASPPWAPAAAGATAGPAALPSVPAATAMDMMPPPPPPCLGDTPHAPHARPCPPMPPIPFESSWSRHRGARWVGWPWIFAAPTWRTARHRGEPESCDTHRPLQVALNRRNEPRQGICLGANYQQKTPYCVLSSRPPVRWAPSEHGDEMLFPAMCAARPPGRLQRHPSLRRICRGATTTPEPPTTQG